MHLTPKATIKHKHFRALQAFQGVNSSFANTVISKPQPDVLSFRYWPLHYQS